MWKRKVGIARINKKEVCKRELNTKLHRCKEKNGNENYEESKGKERRMEIRSPKLVCDWESSKRLVE